ncbi:uncharacterized protein LOC115886491 [Sitophilus oryzae]|uniref:Uncharacterized protein LOC115886491 n=1 Tax=Sitophilus oryzae TaxID=7048 RepID=A0A6J2YF68_SITOR|nr:uncharacterized protein LOC115886491 [Sitophilus oryzae]
MGSEVFTFDLDRSEYYNRRKELIKDVKVPKMSEVESNLGVQASKVILAQCECALRSDFGLNNPLKGPLGDLWVSPSDLLIGKLALKPPFTPKCLQALTHQGIIEIGLELEKKFVQDMEEDKQQILEKMRLKLLAGAEEKLKADLKDVEIRERLLCQVEMEKRKLEFDALLKYELDRLEATMRKQQEEAIKENAKKMKEKWQGRLQEETEQVVKRITAEFLRKLDQQEEALTELFEMELRKQEALRDFDAKMAKTKTQKALRNLKHNMECTNLVDLMYMLCTERQRCCDQKQHIEAYYKNQIEKLHREVKVRDDQIVSLNIVSKQKSEHINMREKCLLEIIRHFQKFINFALRSAPTQAEFLLSVEKMLVFELTDAVAKTDLRLPKPDKMILPWFEPTVEEETVSSLEINDYHQCMNELNPSVAKGSVLGEHDVLPSIYFKNKLYVREDFRDMLSAGVEIRPSGDLWNKDVEILIDNWKKLSQEELPKEKSPASSKSSFSGDIISSNSTTSSMLQRKCKQSQVTFREEFGRGSRSSKQEDTDSHKEMSAKKARRKSSIKPFTVLSEEELIEPVPTESTKILAARDSLELAISRRSAGQEDLEKGINRDGDIYRDRDEEVIIIPSARESQTDTSRELAVETRDSILLRKISLARKPSTEFSPSPIDSIELLKEKEEVRSRGSRRESLDAASEKKEFMEFVNDKCEVRSKSSKLVLARNSLELMRESLMKIQKEYSPPCLRKEQGTDRSSVNAQTYTSHTGSCCTQCKKSVSDRKGSLNGSTSTSNHKAINVPRRDQNMSSVSFQERPTIIKTSQQKVPDRKKKLVKKRRKAPKQKTKVPCRLEVVGDKKAVEGDQTQQEFTAARIHSLINLMKDHPNLLQLFTAGRR